MCISYRQLISVGVIIFFLASCGAGESSSTEGKDKDVIVAKNAESGTSESAVEHSVTTNEGGENKKANSSGICMWEKLGVKESPDGKYVTNIFLGEKFTYLGESVPDKDGKRTQIKIQLSDGTTGWVQSNLVLLKGQAGVVIEEAKVYQRPDLLTETDMAFQKMDFIGIKSEQGDWLQVQGKTKGEKWFWEGWIQKSSLSTLQEDITFTLLVKGAESEKDAKVRNDKLQSILANESVNSSQFKGYVESTLIN